jgi:hypothetical protein
MYGVVSQDRLYNILEQDATIIIRLERGSDVLLTGAVFYRASNCTELSGTAYL